MSSLVDKTNWYSEDELKTLGFKSIGKGCEISRDAKFYGIENMSLANYVRIDDFAILAGNITLGNFVHISAYSNLNGRHGIVMEDFSGCSVRCTFITTSSDYSGQFMICPQIPAEFIKPTIGKIVMKKHTCLAAHSIILPGVCMAEGSVTGASTCLRKSTEPFTIYVGNPAKIFMPRKQNILELEKEFRSKYPDMF